MMAARADIGGVADIVSANSTLQRYGEIAIGLAKARTVQEHPVFPLPPYLLTSYVEGYYQIPRLLRELSAQVSPEEIGLRGRSTPCGVNRLSLLCTFGFYALGREILINLGLQNARDNAGDLIVVADWWNRALRAYASQAGRMYAQDSGGIDEVWSSTEVDMVLQHAISPPSDALLKATRALMGGLTSHSFLAHCESRLGQATHGPYPLPDGKTLIVRSWSELGGSALPWSDVYHELVPYNTITLGLILEDVSVQVDDWGTLASSPEMYTDRICGVVMLDSDPFTDVPNVVGHDEATLIGAMEQLSAGLREARLNVWEYFSERSWSDLVDAGCLMHMNVVSEPMRIGGIFSGHECRRADPRADRLRLLFNDDVSSELFAMRFPHLRRGPYHVNPTTNRAFEPVSLLPLDADPTVTVADVEYSQLRLRSEERRAPQRLAAGQTADPATLNERAKEALARDRETGHRWRSLDAVVGWRVEDGSARSDG